MKKNIIYVSRTRRDLGHPGAFLLIRRAVNATLREENVDERCCVYVTLTDDAGIQEINRKQRGIDRPTDVLSFPMNQLIPGEFDSELCEWDYDAQAVILGDMVLSLPRTQAQGVEFGHGFSRELAYLTVHSVLHLLGYDHMDEGKQKRLMRRREKAVMEALELKRE